jgi:hypothetical protein
MFLVATLTIIIARAEYGKEKLDSPEQPTIQTVWTELSRNEVNPSE